MDVVFPGCNTEIEHMEDASLEVRVRPAAVDDADAIDRLIFHLDEFHAQERPDLFCIPSNSPRGESFLHTVLDDPEQQILVGMILGEVVGYVHVLIKNAPEASYRVERHYSEIESISAHPAAQRIGVGRKLIEGALSWATSRGVRDHQIGVHEFNRTARRLYEHMGFEPSEIMLRRKD